MSNAQKPRELNRGSGQLQRPKETWHGKPRGGGRAMPAASAGAAVTGLAAMLNLGRWLPQRGARGA